MLRSNCTEMKNKLLDSESSVIGEIASSINEQSPANRRYCVRRIAQKSSDITSPLMRCKSSLICLNRDVKPRLIIITNKSM